MTRQVPPMERSADRDSAILAILPLVPERGWTQATLRSALSAAGRDPAAAEYLFPRGSVSVVEAWCDLTDRAMAEEAASAGLEALRIPARIRAIVAIRLRLLAPHKDAVRRAVGLLALPWNLGATGRATARTVDAMWQAAGDVSIDRSWYTRRASLAGIYAATLAFWLQDAEPGAGPTLEFLDRRLAELGRLQRRPKAA